MASVTTRGGPGRVFPRRGGPSHPPDEPDLDQRRLRARVLVGAGLVLVAASVLSLAGVRGPDIGIVHLLNRPAGRSRMLDRAVGDLTDEMFSTLPLVTLLVYEWFRSRDVERRAAVAVGLAAAYTSGIVSRVLQLALPTHDRPLHDPTLGFHLPLGIEPDTLSRWSSFPSDHAAVFSGIAFTVLLLNKRLGLLAYLIALLSLSARVYLGYHFPADVVAGLALGAIVVSAAWGLRRAEPVTRVLGAQHSRPGLFYAAAFYLAYGVVTLFDDLRQVATQFAKVLLHHV